MDGEALEEWIGCDTVGVLWEDMARRKNGFRAWGVFSRRRILSVG